MEREQHKRQRIYNVKPLKTKAQIDDMRRMLKIQGQDVYSTGRTGKRNLMLFDLGINTGLRVSDIVKLKVNDVKGKNSFEIREKKTGKIRNVFIKNLRSEITRYISDLGLKDDEWLFPSHRHGYHLSPTQVYRFLNDAGAMCGFDFIGTHTMRKTFGYWYIKQGGSIATLMVIFNHSSQAVTKRYIGIEDEEIQNELQHFHI